MARKAELGIAREVVDSVAAALADLGFSPEPTLGATEEQLVPGSSADALLDRAADALSIEALGIALARQMPLGTLGLIDYSILTAGTLREGLSRMSRYYGTVTQRVRVTLEEDGDIAALRFHRDPLVKHSRHWIEFSFAATSDRIRQPLGPKARFSHVRFTHSAPSDRRMHDGFFGLPVEFDAPIDSLGFPKALLDLPLRTSAAPLGGVLEARLKELEPQRSAVDPFLDQVRRAVVDLLDQEDPQLESLVAKLSVPRRTLQRELQQRGTSHKQLLDEVRRTRALQLLEDERLTVSEVAYRLGFSEPSAFFRAYRRWTGRSPKGASKPRAQST